MASGKSVTRPAGSPEPAGVGGTGAHLPARPVTFEFPSGFARPVGLACLERTRRQDSGHGVVSAEPHVRKGNFHRSEGDAASLAFLVAFAAIVLAETRGASRFPKTPATDGNSARFDPPFGARGAAWQRRKCCLRSFRANHCRRVGNIQSVLQLEALRMPGQ